MRLRKKRRVDGLSHFFARPLAREQKSDIAVVITTFVVIITIAGFLLTGILLKVAILAAATAGFLVLVFVFVSITRQNEEIDSTIGVFRVSTDVHLWRDVCGARIDAFQRLRASAKYSILIMGIGMTFIANDLEYIENLLRRDIKVELIMVSPEVFTGKNKRHMEKTFDDYYQRTNYAEAIRIAHGQIKSFIERRKGMKNKKGRIALRTYDVFLPMNVTVVDKNRMLIEWCLPFSDWRINTEFTSDCRGAFGEVLKGIDNLSERRSTLVVDDS